MHRTVQLWSYNYDPEPTGIGPVSTALAGELRGRGWRVQVVAAHPHYPEPAWGRRLRPYRETRDGIDVLRLPIWIGRDTPGQRIRQELSYTAALAAALPLIGPPVLARADVVVSASPSFPALLPAMIHVAARRVPWVLWLHDLLPDGAGATGQIDEGGMIMRVSRRLERAAYRRSELIVTLSSPFVDNLLGKGVPSEKVELVYDPATRDFPGTQPPVLDGSRPRIICMGNIGHTQGLAPLVAAFERSPVDAELIITGTGVAAREVSAEVRTGRVSMLGVVSEDELEQELRSAAVGLVTQAYDGTEFNLPSKLMNYMAYGLPVLAAVNPAGEVARIVRESGGGWVVDSSAPDELPRRIEALRTNPEDFAARARAAREYAIRNFSRQSFGARFDQLLSRAVRPTH
jgi:colanic acid biosynthesis glycosyl transferase WcaI